MRKIGCVDLYEGSEVSHMDVKSGRFVPLPNPGKAAKSRDWFMDASTKKVAVYDIYLETYDTAVPADWFDEYQKMHGTPPDAVWCYSTKPGCEDMLKGKQAAIFGEPVFWGDVMGRLSEDAEKTRDVETFPAPVA